MFKKINIPWLENSGNYSFQEHPVGGHYLLVKFLLFPHLWFQIFSLSTLQWVAPLNEGSTRIRVPTVYRLRWALIQVMPLSSVRHYLTWKTLHSLKPFSPILSPRGRTLLSMSGLLLYGGPQTSLQIAHKNKRTSTDFGPSLSTFLGTPLTQALPLYSL